MNDPILVTHYGREQYPHSDGDVLRCPRACRILCIDPYAAADWGRSCTELGGHVANAQKKQTSTVSNPWLPPHPPLASWHDREHWLAHAHASRLPMHVVRLRPVLNVPVRTSRSGRPQPHHQQDDRRLAGQGSLAGYGAHRARHQGDLRPAHRAGFLRPLQVPLRRGSPMLQGGRHRLGCQVRQGLRQGQLACRVGRHDGVSAQIQVSAEGGFRRDGGGGRW